MFISRFGVGDDGPAVAHCRRPRSPPERTMRRTVTRTMGGSRDDVHSPMTLTSTRFGRLPSNSP